MKFNLKIQPETFSTPDRKTFIVTNIEAYPVGSGSTTAEGIDQILFYFSFNGENGESYSGSNANVEQVIILESGEYPLLSNLFSTDPVIKYEAMSIIAMSYNYIPLPFEEQ